MPPPADDSRTRTCRAWTPIRSRTVVTPVPAGQQVVDVAAPDTKDAVIDGQPVEPGDVATNPVDSDPAQPSTGTAANAALATRTGAAAAPVAGSAGGGASSWRPLRFPSPSRRGVASPKLAAQPAPGTAQSTRAVARLRQPRHHPRPRRRGSQPRPVRLGLPLTRRHRRARTRGRRVRRRTGRTRRSRV